jgi:DeoR/GlpR family transcriptional regulator of sugar metabolism
MLAVERQKSILEQLKKDGHVRVRHLSAVFGVNEETVRRDLKKMEDEGLVIRGHGGAVLNADTSVELPFNVRMKRNIGAKQEIARITAGLVRDGMHIMLDASSTLVYIAKAISNKKGLTIVTNSLEIIVEMSNRPNVSLISTGGCLDTGYLAFTGPKTIHSIKEYATDIAVISCMGLDMERGIMDSNDSMAEIKHTTMSSTRSCILAADHTKFGRTSFSHICEIRDIDYVVTDEAPDDLWIKFFEREGIICLHPGKEKVGI